MEIADNSRLGVISEKKQVDGNTVIETKRASGFWLPKKTTTLDSNGDVFCIEHLYENGLTVKRQKVDGKFRVIHIKHRDIIPSLYEDVSINPQRRMSHGMLISEETLRIYETLPAELKRVCEPAMNYLVNRAQNAVKTNKSWFERLRYFLKLK